MQLDGIKVAALVTDGFEQSELLSLKEALEKAGATVLVVSPKDDKVKTIVEQSTKAGSTQNATATSRGLQS